MEKAQIIKRGTTLSQVWETVLRISSSSTDRLAEITVESNQAKDEATWEAGLPWTWIKIQRKIKDHGIGDIE